MRSENEHAIGGLRQPHKACERVEHAIMTGLRIRITSLKHLTAHSSYRDFMDRALAGDVGKIPDLGEVRADILEVLGGTLNPCTLHTP
eukprot:1777123-Amphidinium_carterae.2